ncbi:MAG: M28 family peptidase [Candidatus Zhuqueibacterota bacterium]
MKPVFLLQNNFKFHKLTWSLPKTPFVNFGRFYEDKLDKKHVLAMRRKLHRHVHVLSEEIGPRNLNHYICLNKASDYISGEMKNAEGLFSTQPYKCDKKEVANLIFEKPGSERPEEILIIGAHYDTVLESPGADDNATGIAALLELIHLLHDYPNSRTLRFVAFTLEEPPYFGTDLMGSRYYARHCFEMKEQIVGMIAFEMLGYFSEKKRSQKYPISSMAQKFPSTGNFLAVLGNNQSDLLTKQITLFMREPSLLDIGSFITYNHIPGNELSDHSSFWHYNYPAAMITDTAFYRNPHYHEITDSIDKLNFRYFAKGVLSMAHMLKKLDRFTDL